MKKRLVLILLSLILMIIFLGCDIAPGDQDRINKRLYEHYGSLLPMEMDFINSLFRGTYTDENGELVVRVGVEAGDTLFEPLVEEMKRIAWPSKKQMPTIHFLSAKLSREEQLILYDEITKASEIKDDIWSKVRGIGANGTGGIDITVMDLNEEIAANIRKEISNPVPVNFEPYINMEDSKVKKNKNVIMNNLKQKDYKEIVQRLEEEYGPAYEQFPVFRVGEDNPYWGNYLNDSKELVILVGIPEFLPMLSVVKQRNPEFDEMVSQMKAIAWPKEEPMPEVIFAPARLTTGLLRLETYELWEEIDQVFCENYFDKNSVWSSVTGLGYYSDYVGIVVRDLDEEKKAKFRSEVSNPNVLYFQEALLKVPSPY